MRVTFLAQGDNGKLWCGSNSWLTDYVSGALATYHLQLRGLFNNITRLYMIIHKMENVCQSIFISSKIGIYFCL